LLREALHMDVRVPRAQDAQERLEPVLLPAFVDRG
jgi:hypothetical protein